METWVEEMEGWDDRPFSDGYAGLHDLSAADFSGAVSAGDAWLFMVSGRVVAVVEYRQTRDGDEVVSADIEQFEEATGTVYDAPHPSVPLLVAMQATGGETRGKYYTEDTPVEEVLETLEEGRFTGYLELSENVLSGDYYAVFQSGRSTPLAFIGNARRLLTEEEAHERLTDEVGIYEVVSAGIDVVEIPGEPDDESAVAGAAGAAGAAAGESLTDTAADAENDGGGESDSVSGDAATVDDADGSDGDAAANSVPDAAGAEESPPEESPPDDSDAGDEETADDAATPAGTPADSAASDDDPVDDPDADADEEPMDGPEAKAADSAGDPAAGGPVVDESVDSAAEEERDPASSTGDPADDDAVDPATARAASGPVGDLETRSVPSLDPEQSWSDDGEATTESGSPGEAVAADEAGAPDETDGADEERAELRAQLREARSKLADAREQLASVRDERDDLAATVEELRARVADLEGEASEGGPSLSVAEALAGTNLFVRYDSKGRTTVEDVHDGSGAVEDLRENLQLADHTKFESENATVEGEAFDSWLTGTLQYRFAEWLVTTLVVEIRETGAADGLRELYDVLPEIDRIELDGSVTVTDEEGDRDASFDVVCRDRMGDPLVVARLERSRDPVTETSMGSLVTDATDVATDESSLSGVFSVTSAFFSPESLETAREATSGSLLSRDKRRSYVKISRKRGYHLGLVESREETFHLSVPDL
ncbi:DUF7527 domain-containing protein [Halorarius halobius]|uniref:DUF7527 domain-containing protein n=1 Tax=Halorarius halobius TaxID=2962671 RepID=UPI0020CC4981|nr:hypothetical protein [Halorarius halobius]